MLILVVSSTAQARYPLAIVEAAQANHMSAVAQFVKGGVDVNVVNAIGRSSVHYAVLNDNPHTLKILLKYGANPNLVDMHGKTPLDLWHEDKSTEVLEILQKAGARHAQAEVTERQSEETTDNVPEEKQHDVSKNLTNHDTQDKKEEQESETQDLLEALENNDLASVERLLKGKPLLHLAIAAGDWHLVRMLIREGEDVFAGSQSALDVARMMKSERKLIKAFTAEKKKTIDKGFGGDVQFISAAKNGRVEEADFLIACGANPNKYDFDRLTPLLYATMNGHTAMVEFLVKRCAKINIQDGNGRTALMYAVKNGHTEIAKFLIKRRAALNISDYDGNTALSYALYYKRTEITELLVSRGANINRQSHGGWTELMIVAKRGQIDMVEFLIKKGAKINITSRSGHTALKDAALMEHTEIVRLLLKHGAKINVSNSEGSYPIAYRENAHKIKKIILQAAP